MTDVNRLIEPFDPFDIEWRVQTAGETANSKLWAILVPYVTNRAIQDRLDAVCGADGWYNTFQYPTDKAVICGISIKCGDEWVTKWDGAEETAIEAVKGGLSSAMKRAAVQWGIGRYLYRLDSAIVSPVKDDPKNPDYIMAHVKIDGKKMRIWFRRPNLPTWALPTGKEAA